MAGRPRDRSLQVVVVADTFLHDDGSASSSSPSLVVSSVSDPSVLAVKVPVTLMDPEVTTAFLQSVPSPDRSTPPETFRHDEVTFQVPTTSPPQAVTSVQASPPLLLVVVPPVAAPLDEVGEVPPEGDGVLLLDEAEVPPDAGGLVLANCEAPPDAGVLLVDALPPASTALLPPVAVEAL